MYAACAITGMERAKPLLHTAIPCLRRMLYYYTPTDLTEFNIAENFLNVAACLVAACLVAAAPRLSTMLHKYLSVLTIKSGEIANNLSSSYYREQIMFCKKNLIFSQKFGSGNCLLYQKIGIKTFPYNI